MRPERAGPDDAPSNGGTPSTPRRYSVVWADAELERELAGLGHEFELLGLTEGLLQLRRIAATGDGAVFDVPVASVKELRARDGGRAAGDLVRALVSNTRR
jgi:hypothetical protein